MALTEFQRAVCRLIARRRVAGGESYVAGGAALNTLAPAARVSRDIDLAGCCVLAADLTLFRGAADALADALQARRLQYHAGSIRGAWPRIRGGSQDPR